MFWFRLSLAVVFIYAAISSFLAPDNWIGYFPLFLRNLVPQSLLLNGFSIYEVFLGLWLFSGKFIRFSSIFAALTLSGIVVFNYNQMDVIFRDLGLLLVAVGIFFNSKKS